MLQEKKFQEFRCMRLFSVKQNIEGDANLHHPLFLAENYNFFAFEGSKNEKSSYFSLKMYLEADFWLGCSIK